MAPIHETDVAEERWHSASWRNFELWERIELRLKRRRTLLVVLTVTLFLVLSAIPIIGERGLKWKGVVASRRISQVISQVKRDAATLRIPVRMTIDPTQGTLLVTTVARCGSAELTPEGDVSPAPLRSESVFEPGTLRLLTPADAARFELSEVTDEFCFDPAQGSEATAGDHTRGIAVVPEVDFQSGRSDRVSAVLIRGASAELSFD